MLQLSRKSGRDWRQMRKKRVSSASPGHQRRTTRRFAPSFRDQVSDALLKVVDLMDLPIASVKSWQDISASIPGRDIMVRAETHLTREGRRILARQSCVNRFRKLPDRLKQFWLEDVNVFKPGPRAEPGSGKRTGPWTAWEDGRLFLGQRSARVRVLPALTATSCRLLRRSGHSRQLERCPA